MIDKTRSLIKDTFVFALGSIGSKIILFLMVPLYTNYLTTEEYGVAELVFTYSQFLVPISSLMVYDAVLRFGISKDEKKEDVSKNSLLVVGISFIITLVLGNAMAYWGGFAEWRRYLQYYTISACLLQYGLNYLKVQNKNRTFSMVSIIQTFLLAVLNIILVAKANLGIEGYLLANTIATFLAAMGAIIVSGLIVDAHKGRYNLSLLLKMLKYSIPLILNNISWWLINSSDKIMIKDMIDEHSLGLYTVAAKIPSLINVIIGIFIQAWGLSSIKEVENNVSDTKFMSSVFEVYTSVVFGISIVLVAIMKPFMSVYVGASFKIAWKYTPLLLAAATFYAIASYYASLYVALKRTINSMWTTVICAIINISINYIGIKMLGVWGAILGTLISFIFLAIVRSIDVSRYIRLNLNNRETVINSIILLFQSVLVSLDYHPFIISLLVILLYFFNSKATLLEVVHRTIDWVKFHLYKNNE